MAHMSNRDRIARAAEEASLAAAEKAAKKEAKAAGSGRSRRAARPTRMKIVWEVCNGAGTAVQTFPYPDKAAAELATESLTKSTGRIHVLRPSKVPME
jgi:hypothetical protein